MTYRVLFQLGLCFFSVIAGSVFTAPKMFGQEIQIVLNPRVCVHEAETKVDACPAVVQKICPAGPCSPGEASGYTCYTDDDGDGVKTDFHAITIYDVNYEGTVAGAAPGNNRTPVASVFLECYRTRPCFCEQNDLGQFICKSKDPTNIYGNVFWTASPRPCPTITSDN